MISLFFLKTSMNGYFHLVWPIMVCYLISLVPNKENTQNMLRSQFFGDQIKICMCNQRDPGLIISLEASMFQILDFLFFSCIEVEKSWSHHTLTPEMREKNIFENEKENTSEEKPPNDPLCGQGDGQKEG